MEIAERARDFVVLNNAILGGTAVERKELIGFIALNQGSRDQWRDHFPEASWQMSKLARKLIRAAIKFANESSEKVLIKIAQRKHYPGTRLLVNIDGKNIGYLEQVHRMPLAFVDLNINIEHPYNEPDEPSESKEPNELNELNNSESNSPTAEQPQQPQPTTPSPPEVEIREEKVTGISFFSLTAYTV